MFPATVFKGSFFSTSLPIFVICVSLDDSDSDRCELVCYCGFDVHFSDD